ncbi:MAG: hypothetical protein M3Y36_00120 [Actinomycetota bacterium]|nr:hypothetical protein [Actinomycetota bacterium]
MGPGFVGPGFVGPDGRGSPAPFVAPDAALGESTQYWNRARRTPIVDLPPMPAQKRSHAKLWAAGAGAAVVIVAIVAALLLTRSPARPQVTTNTVTPPSNPQPTQYQPVDLTVVNESGTTATLRWKDPSNGLYPFVVQVVGVTGAQPTNTSTQTVIASLEATKGYCFVVGALYALGSPPAYAAPVCIRGATATSTTTPAPGRTPASSVPGSLPGSNPSG